MPFEFSKIIMIAISGITGILILKKAPYRNIFKILIFLDNKKRGKIKNIYLLNKGCYEKVLLNEWERREAQDFRKSS